MSEQVEVQVREGVWRTRGGEQVEVRARDTTAFETEWRWYGERYGHMVTWRDDGTIHIERRTSNGDLMQFLRPLPEPEPEPEPEPTPEPQPVRVREGVWLTRDGAHVEVQANHTANAAEFPWRGMLCGVSEIWHDDGRWRISGGDHYRDLVQYVGPLPEQTAPEPEVEPEPQPTSELQPEQVCEGLWKTRSGQLVEVRARQDKVQMQYRWIGSLFGVAYRWRDDGRKSGDMEHHCDLVAYVGPLPQQTTTDTKRVEICEGVWRTRDGRQVHVRENTDWRLPSHPWAAEFDGEQYIWMRDGQYHAGADSPADLVAYLRPLPKAETTTETLAEIEEQAAEDLQQWMEATALQRRRLEAELALVTSERETLRADLTEVASERDALVREINEVTAERDRLQQAHQTMTKHSAELLESGQQARDQRDLLAQQLVTKPSEEALQKEVSRKQIEINTLQDKLEAMTDDRETLRRQFVAMTADRDRLQAELARETESLQNERFQAQTAHAGCKRAEEHLEEATAEVQRLTAELRQAQIDLDAEGETPASNCRAIAEGHLIGAQSGRQAAFEAVERWLEPLAGADSEHAAAILQALPGCIRKLAELEGVTW